jgi:hypothetical protein
LVFDQLARNGSSTAATSLAGLDAHLQPSKAGALPGSS